MSGEHTDKRSRRNSGTSVASGISVTSSMNSTPLFKDHTVNAIDYLDLKKGYTAEETITGILDDPLNPAFVDVLSMTVKQLQNLKGHSAGMVQMHDNDLAVKQDHESKTQREIETAIALADEAWAVYEEAHTDAREKSENLSVLKNTALVLDSEIKTIRRERPARALLEELSNYILNTKIEQRHFGQNATQLMVQEKIKFTSWSQVLVSTLKEKNRANLVLINLGFEHCPEFIAMWENQAEETKANWVSHGSYAQDPYLTILR